MYISDNDLYTETINLHLRTLDFLEVQFFDDENDVAGCCDDAAVLLL